MFPVGFGAMVLSPGLYGRVDEDQAVSALTHAVDSGVGFVDTSDSYGAESHNELLVGRVLGGRHRDVLVGTKFGFRPPTGVDRHRFRVGYRYGELAVNCDPRHVRGYAEASARRLGTDRIGLLSPHFPDPVVPIEETVGAIAGLVHDGLVEMIGLCNVTAAQLLLALKVAPIAAVQVEWSLWKPIEPELLVVAEAAGVAIMAWGPLGAGLLTGSVEGLTSDDFRRNFPRFDGANLDANRDGFAPLAALADRWGITPGQLSLAWLLHQSPLVIPIPGSRTASHIDENLDAATIELDEAQLSAISEAVARFTPVGATLFDVGTSPARTDTT